MGFSGLNDFLNLGRFFERGFKELGEIFNLYVFFIFKFSYYFLNVFFGKLILLMKVLERRVFKYLKNKNYFCMWFLKIGEIK